MYINERSPEKVSSSFPRNNLPFLISVNKPGQEGEGDQEMDQDQSRTELTQVEISLCKQNFGFYDTKKVGSVERFELPMLLNGKSCFTDSNKI